ncbi:MAG TPA: hypothetical protein PLY32_00655 [Salinivirgaceae bacterium]|nr:hypothetical protein [Salinivirgaceae bacterium]HQA75606.1 hypothetical protein [Salinivirgaceae bacterium]
MNNEQLAMTTINFYADSAYAVSTFNTSVVIEPAEMLRSVHRFINF